MSKFSKKIGTPEMNSARSKLDGLLQTLVEKKDDKSGGIEGGIIDPSDETSRDSVPNTPTKRSSATSGRGSNRKKRKGVKDDTFTETAQYHHTYVMKLFDRSVDLAQFDETTPLYPICRAWMRNQPHNRNLGVRERSVTPPPTSDDDEEDVFELPGLVEVSLMKMKREPGSAPQDLRVPEPVSCSDSPLDISAAPSVAPEQLLLNHMARWKIIRTRWRDAGRLYETRFAPSMHILKDMYEKQCKE